MIETSRRGFLAGLGAGLVVLAAPAVIRTPGLIMPVRAWVDELVRVRHVGYFDIVQPWVDVAVEKSEGSEWVEVFRTQMNILGISRWVAPPGDEVTLKNGGQLVDVQITGDGHASLIVRGGDHKTGFTAEVHAGDFTKRKSFVVDDKMSGVSLFRGPIQL